MPKDFPYETVGIPRSYPWDHGRVEVPVWTYNGHAVWGMTARLVRDIVSTLWKKIRIKQELAAAAFPCFTDFLVAFLYFYPKIYRPFSEKQRFFLEV